MLRKKGLTTPAECIIHVPIKLSCKSAEACEKNSRCLWKEKLC